MYFQRSTSSFGLAVSLALLLAGVAACASGPKFQGMDASQIYAYGDSAFAREDWGEAAEAFDRFLLAFPSDARAADARLKLGRAYMEDGKHLIAADEFFRFLERHRGHEMAPEAALGACRAYARLSPIPQRDQEFTVQAVSVCVDAATDYSEHEAGQEASEVANRMRAKLAQKEYEAGEYYYDRGAFDSAIIFWDELVDEYGDTEWAPRALLGIIRAYTEIGYDDLVDEYRTRLLNSYPDSDAAGEVRDAFAG